MYKIRNIDGKPYIYWKRGCHTLTVNDERELDILCRSDAPYETACGYTNGLGSQCDKFGQILALSLIKKVEYDILFDRGGYEVFEETPVLISSREIPDGHNIFLHVLNHEYSLCSSIDIPDLINVEINMQSCMNLLIDNGINAGILKLDDYIKRYNDYFMIHGWEKRIEL